jgi:hypothetical protein
VTKRFTELLQARRLASLGRTMVADDAANDLPLDAQREPFRWTDREHEHGWIVRAWEASIEDAARELHNLITIHDNGGTASSPKKIKRAARELLRLLGEE